MSNYVGIDLGTTNSVICSYDGDRTRIWKSPEQNDVTPSAIYIGPRGNKHVGRRAYDMSSHSPNNVAMLFKRFIGTSTPIELSAVDTTMTPVECSAEILRVLFGYLPEEIRSAPNTGTVITVPAAFNQMQKNATMEAAKLAGIGQVKLVQEPVAAIMSITKAHNADGTFVVYDLGGGTLDIAVAKNQGGHINLMAQGGIPMCGGRDFDRLLVDEVIVPWLLKEFDLPEDLSANPNYKSLLRLAAWAGEQAKINLSASNLSASNEETISLSEMQINARDRSGKKIYIDTKVDRNKLNSLIKEKVDESIEAVRETLEKMELSPHDVDRIVFIGGPTSYKPLRDKVSDELGISASAEVNPMTAVAEGAALFAESIDWGFAERDPGNPPNEGHRDRPESWGPFDRPTFEYTERTLKTRTEIVVKIGGEVMPGAEFQVKSLDTGWDSGYIALKNGAAVDVPLPNNGKNNFRVFVRDASGGPLKIKEDMIVITRTAVTVKVIPASHSVGIEVLEETSGNIDDQQQAPTGIEWLIREGDPLPKKGTCYLKTAKSLEAGSAGSLNFRLLEGDSDEPSDNRFIGTFKITGRDFPYGMIPAGADIECEFKVLDSGQIELKVSVPSIWATFQPGNYYSRQEVQLDSGELKRVKEKGEETLSKLGEFEALLRSSIQITEDGGVQRPDEINAALKDRRLPRIRKKLELSLLLNPDKPDLELILEARDGVDEARRLLAQVRKDHQPLVRQSQLDTLIEYFYEIFRKFGVRLSPSQKSEIKKMKESAQLSIDNDDRDFETHRHNLEDYLFFIAFDQDEYVIGFFQYVKNLRHRYSDQNEFNKLVSEGEKALERGDINRLREVVFDLLRIMINTTGPDDDPFDPVDVFPG